MRVVSIWILISSWILYFLVSKFLFNWLSILVPLNRLEFLVSLRLSLCVLHNSLQSLLLTLSNVNLCFAIIAVTTTVASRIILSFCSGITSWISTSVLHYWMVVSFASFSDNSIEGVLCSMVAISSPWESVNLLRHLTWLIHTHSLQVSCLGWGEGKNKCYYCNIFHFVFDK
jgi:hypothetical protein